MTDPDVRTRAWRHARGSLQLDPPVVMAVLNVTPDSFHDGGALSRAGEVDPDRVLESASAAVRAGARLLDIGGESTRPGAAAVDATDELARVLPAIRAMASLDVAVSVDTRRASVADAALRAGAVIVNDVSGLSDPAMADVVAQHGAGLVVGHLRGQPDTMQASIEFSDLLGEVAAELSQSVARAQEAGVSLGHMLVDPGVGFGKTASQSAALVACSRTLERAVGVPVMIGASRKSFIGAVIPTSPADRLPGSLAAAVVAVQHGAAVVRVHDVPETVQALAVAAAVEQAISAAGSLPSATTRERA